MPGQRPEEGTPDSEKITQKVIVPEKEAARPSPSELKASLEPAVREVEQQRQKIAKALTQALSASEVKAGALEEDEVTGKTDTVSREMRGSEIREFFREEFKTGDFDVWKSEAVGVDALLGKYRIQQELGRGGMAIAYLAIDTETGENVVIKMLQQSDAGEKRRFIQEIVTISLLRHKNIVRNIRHGRTDKGVYYVMPYFSRGDLRDMNEEFAGMSEGEITDWCETKLLPLVRAIEYLHRKGLMHADIKPANIFIDDKGDLALGDFGLASISSEYQSSEKDEIVGTPWYMAPEQVVDKKNIGPSTDFFALAATLYELFAGQSIHGKGLKEVGELIGIIDEYAKGKVAITPLRQLNPRVPETIAALIMQMLSPTPKQRIAEGQVSKRFRAAIKKSKVVPGQKETVENGKVT